MPTTPLTAEEIASLRARLEDHYEGGIAMGARAPILRLLDEVERSRALLKRIEWKGSPVQEPERICPECGADDRFGQGHVPDCELAALLRPAE